ncbi:Dabb family protein [Paenibacillus sp. sgz5001063]|uniref:Dabb family protein n=1 Tax=Paenibacillus sp. sgz5001063 TaxID=3242474 RepID=UPI0036D432FE
MYEHIVLFKFNNSGTEEKQEEIIQTVNSFKTSIPGIIELTAGINVTEEVEHKNGFTVGIRITFEDKQASQNYFHHPLHQQFLQNAGSSIDSVIVVDYPFH